MSGGHEAHGHDAHGAGGHEAGGHHAAPSHGHDSHKSSHGGHSGGGGFDFKEVITGGAYLVAGPEAIGEVYNAMTSSVDVTHLFSLEQTTTSVAGVIPGAETVSGFGMISLGGLFLKGFSHYWSLV